MDIQIKFTGEQADGHALPALEAAQSLEGLTRSITLVANYLAEGKVRKKFPFSENFDLQWRATRPGSFETIFDLTINSGAITEWLIRAGIFTGAVASSVIVKVTSEFVTDGLKYVFKRRIGKPHTPQTDELQKIQANKSGDLDAVIDAILPSAKRSHSVIDHGAKNIYLIAGSNNIVNFDHSSKIYLSSPIATEELFTKLVSVGSFNVNTRYGRVFDFELGRTVAFIIDHDATHRTIPKLGLSLARYSDDREKGDIFIQYKKKTALNGEPELYIIVDAWFENDAEPADLD